MNITCDKCRDTDPDCQSCHGHPYVSCKKAGCVMWMRDGYEEWRSVGDVMREGVALMAGARQFAVNAMPMSTFGDLLEKGRQRYLNGNGSWEKKEPLDQIDLVYMEAMEEPVPSRVIARLVQELRTERSWPTPPKVEPNFTYVDKE